MVGEDNLRPKDNNNKLFYEIDWEFIEGMAKRMALNKQNGKYVRFSWKDQDLNMADFNQALVRHLIEILKGNLNDEQEFGHYYALACNSMMIINSLKYKEKAIQTKLNF